MGRRIVFYFCFKSFGSLQLLYTLLFLRPTMSMELTGYESTLKTVDQFTVDRDTEGPELYSQSLFYAPVVLFPAIDFFHLSSTYFLNLSSIKSHVLAFPTCSNVPLLLAHVMIQYSSTPSPITVPITL